MSAALDAGVFTRTVVEPEDRVERRVVEDRHVSRSSGRTAPDRPVDVIVDVFQAAVGAWLAGLVPRRVAEGGEIGIGAHDQVHVLLDRLCLVGEGCGHIVVLRNCVAGRILSWVAESTAPAVVLITN